MIQTNMFFLQNLQSSESKIQLQGVADEQTETLFVQQAVSWWFGQVKKARWGRAPGEAHLPGGHQERSWAPPPSAGGAEFAIWNGAVSIKYIFAGILSGIPHVLCVQWTNFSEKLHVENMFWCLRDLVGIGWGDNMWVRAPFPVMMLRLCPLVDNTDYWLLPSIFDYAQGENQPPWKSRHTLDWNYFSGPLNLQLDCYV